MEQFHPYSDPHNFRRCGATPVIQNVPPSMKTAIKVRLPLCRRSDRAGLLCAERQSVYGAPVEINKVSRPVWVKASEQQPDGIAANDCQGS
ncbi:hypothetical protein MHYP_G00140080 [Metynnis hypsauchen]